MVIFMVRIPRPHRPIFDAEKTPLSGRTGNFFRIGTPAAFPPSRSGDDQRGRLRKVIEARKVTDFTPIVAAAGAPSWVCHRPRRIWRDFRSYQGASFVFFAVFRSHLGPSARPPAAGLRSHHFGDSLTNLVTGLVRPATPARRHPPSSGVETPVRSFVVRSLFHAAAAFGRPGTF
jgi:hypothetical protein